MRLRGMLVVVVLTVAGCTTSVQGAPVPKPAADPAARYLHADPCGFVSAALLGKFGKVAPPEPSFDSCLDVVSAAAGGTVLVSVGLITDRPVSDRQPTKVGGLTVYQDPVDTSVCAREIAVMPGVVITLLAPGDPHPCEIADALTASIAKTVHDGAIAQTHYPPGSLASRDACSVLDAPQAPGAVAEQHPGFARHSCQWGSDTEGEPTVAVRFSLGPAAHASHVDSRLVTIDGHNAVEQYVAPPPRPESQRTLPICAVTVDVQPESPPRAGYVETASVVVTADVDREPLCRQATELTTEMIGKLSG